MMCAKAQVSAGQVVCVALAFFLDIPFLFLLGCLSSIFLDGVQMRIPFVKDSLITVLYAERARTQDTPEASLFLSRLASLSRCT